MFVSFVSMKIKKESAKMSKRYITIAVVALVAVAVVNRIPQLRAIVYGS